MADNTDNIIVDTATRIFQDLCEPGTVNEAEQGEWPKALWDALEESGLTLTWVPEELGGAGAALADGFAVLRAAGRFAAPVPLAETLMAGWLLTKAGIAMPGGPLTIAPIHADGRILLTADGALSGRARRVPFARNASHIAVLARRGDETVVALVAVADLLISQSTSLAGEPRDDVSFDGAIPEAVRPAAAVDQDLLICFGAAVRLQQMSGALEKILEQSVQYALDRVQFGRPIAKFQAVQHNLATLAGEVAAASAAADAAAEACARPEIAIGEVAIAKVRGGEAAGTGAAIAHQVHGAMGFTHEHSLHHATRRLWSWREEFGNEAVWAARLGKMVAERGADGLWPFITAGS
jgi:alkylation response protein AidB-like acyl-CoA dehydrogenase